ncbi:MAG: hypothetical protein A2161_13250 [Candidatus Schekmanbacteria bacterium RBG_13_48_7]|uniref:Thioredoxin domain-containing protein n=1 Tax=Candidatus Schekmanbacteria bacterium RBG_13_48_7 TaxID=1817878 RepID=A0A1F7RR80_9BACT|nr:MAG: hypothetical protein A2161_13250 [Candidatus Schekmanbacteria bacterium RBG_13_48_7]
MKTSRFNKVLMLSLVLVALVASTTSVFSVESEKSNTSPGIKEIVFITKTKACACTMKRIKDGEHILRKTLNNIDKKISYTTVNTQTDVVRAAKLRKLANYNFLPVIMFLDDEGKLLAKLDAFITEEKLLEIINKYKIIEPESGD